MRVAPIIHTRTFSCDFNTEFLVRPDRFMDSDIKWARKNVLGATGEIDGLQGVRWLIADNEKYRMAGVVGFLKSICSKCQLSVGDKQRSEELFCDNKGRLVYAFIGVVIDKINNIDYGKLTYEYLWNMYLSKMYPIWKRTYQEVSLEPFTDIKVEIASKFEPRESVFVGSKELLESNQALDYDLFIDYLCNNNKDHFSFCSNIMDFIMVKQSDFSIVTTSQNIIIRMKRDNIIVPSFESEEQQIKESLSIEEKEPIEMTESKKKKFRNIDDLFSDIISNYSNVIIDKEDGFGSEQWSIDIERFKRDEYPKSLGRTSRKHGFILMMKREKSNGR